MRILLLQDAPHLPTFGGGNKANRRLLEGLVELGHHCEMVSRARNQTMAPVTVAELEEAFRERRVVWRRSNAGRVFAYCYRGVEVKALDSMGDPERAKFVQQRVAAFEPDWILVSDDRRGFLLGPALAAAPRRTVALVHTLFHLPFGPESKTPADLRAVNHQTCDLGQARAVLTVSRYAREYLLEHGGLSSHVVRFPVFDEMPCPRRQGPMGERVAMVNPCPAKGLDVFLALARNFPHLPFTAVPTWGADGDTLARLAKLPNLTLVPPADDLGPFLDTVRVLVAPSQIPETLGYVVIEAMARAIPVLASDLGGLPEAKLKVPYLIPATDHEAWITTLGELLSDPRRETDLATKSRDMAVNFITGATAEHFAAELTQLADG